MKKILLIISLLFLNLSFLFSQQLEIKDGIYYKAVVHIFDRAGINYPAMFQRDEGEPVNYTSDERDGLHVFFRALDLFGMIQHFRAGHLLEINPKGIRVADIVA